MITSAQIATYLADLRLAQSIHMDKLVRKEKLAGSDLFSGRVIASILNCYTGIVIDYFGQPVYNVDGYFLTTYNFFDEEEIKDIILRINKITDNNYYLDL